MMPPAPPAPKIRSPLSPAPVSFIHHPSPNVHGPTKPWTSSPGLPLSHGYTVIVTIIDRFSKLAHFIPLPKLHSARETADILVREVFCWHGLPQDIVSDRGP